MQLFDELSELPSALQSEQLAQNSWLTSTERDRMGVLLAHAQQAQEFFSQLSENVGSLGAAEQSLLPGDRLCGRFELRGFIARGGMGEVYRAWDERVKELVALKVLRPEFARQAALLDRFSEEIRLGRAINSAHVCRLHDLYSHTTADGSEIVFFAMKLIEGETLAERLRREGPMTLEQASPLVRQMLEGLEAAHREGVLHGDFKSANVMLESSADGPPRAVITDFGLSRLATDTTVAAVQGHSRGYTAPEQRQPGPLTAAADIYSFGVVVYEMLTGKLPFEAGPLKGKWAKVVAKCLEDVPGRRYSVVGDVAVALGVDHSPHWTRRRILAIAATASVATAGGVTAWRSRGQEPGSPSIAVLPLEVSNADLRFLADGISDRLADLLSRVPRLRLLPRSAAARGGKPGETVEQKVRRLGVDHVFAGAVMQADSRSSRYRVRLELTDSAGVTSLWSATTEGTPLDLEMAYSQAARAAVDVLAAEHPVRGWEVGLATRSEEAYRLYLLGRHAADRREGSWADEAVRLLTKAIELDPNFAQAHAALSMALYSIATNDGLSRSEMTVKANRSAELALRISPQAEAHAVLGANRHFWDWDWTGAENHFRKAIEISPSAMRGHFWYARLLYCLGRFPAALQEAELAGQCDPLFPSIRVLRGVALTYSGDMEAGIREFRALQAADPAYPYVNAPLSIALEAAGKTAEAVKAARRAVAATGRASFALAALGYALARHGDSEAATVLNEIFARHQAHRAAPGMIARVYAGLKDAPRAMEWIGRARQDRDEIIVGLRWDPTWQFLRDGGQLWPLLGELKYPAV